MTTTNLKSIIAAIATIGLVACGGASQGSNPGDPPVITPDDLSVAITSPSNGATVSGIIMITATAANADSVQFEVDGAPVSNVLTAAPYTYNLNTATLSNGSHTVTAYAVAGSEDIRSTPVTITVNNVAVVDPCAPYDNWDGTVISCGGTTFRLRNYVDGDICMTRIDFDEGPGNVGSVPSTNIDFPSPDAVTITNTSGTGADTCDVQ